MAGICPPIKIAGWKKLATASLRILVGGIGLFACFWAYETLPVVRGYLAINEIGASVRNGAGYGDSDLAAYQTSLEHVEAATDSRPAALRNAMTIRLRLLENALKDGTRDEIAGRARRLRHSVIRLLSAAPADSYGWLTLYWLSNFQTGFSPSHLSYLRMSYSVGPNEGWIAVRRNPLALALFAELPPDLAEQAVTEFVRLVNSGLYKEAAIILIGPAWPIRDVLLPRLADASLRYRSMFARYLLGLGYRVEVPGVINPTLRPWR